MKNEILKAGDTVSFTNNSGSFVELKVTRVEAKSWYCGNTRRSFGTLADFKKSFPDFKIEPSK